MAVQQMAPAAQVPDFATFHPQRRVTLFFLELAPQYREGPGTSTHTSHHSMDIFSQTYDLHGS